MSTSSLFISGINFKLLLKTGWLRTYLSPEILLNQIPWQVKVLRRSFLGEDSVDVFLVCSPASNESHWTCEAKATFTLEPIGAGQQPYEKSFPMTKFSKDANTKGIAPFTTWNELMKYAHNDEVKFNVQLAANPILYMTPTNTVHFGAIFRHTIDNINQLETESTHEIQLEGARWYVEFSKKGGHLLGVSLRRIRDPQNDNWTWETQFSFKIESFGRNVHPILRDSHNCFSSRSAKSIHFIGLNELLDPVKQYVKNDAIIVEIDLKVSAPKPLWDIGQEPSMNDSLEQTVNDELKCPICLQNVILRWPVKTKCGHLFCEDCIRTAIEAHKKCPYCNAASEQSELRHIHLDY